MLRLNRVRVHSISNRQFNTTMLVKVRRSNDVCKQSFGPTEVHNANKPLPSDAAKAISTKNGNATRCQSGKYPYHSIMAAMRHIVIAKSTKLVTTAPAGMISRGKYTFEIRLLLPMRLLLDSANAVEKNCQGIMAANTRSA